MKRWLDFLCESLLLLGAGVLLLAIAYAAWVELTR